MYPFDKLNPNSATCIPPIACVSLNPEAEPFCPAQIEIRYQGINIGNLDETFTEELDPNIAPGALKFPRLKHPQW